MTLTQILQFDKMLCFANGLDRLELDAQFHQTGAALRIRSLIIMAAMLAAARSTIGCLNESGTNRLGERVEPWSYTGQNLKPLLVTQTSKDTLVPWSNSVVASVRKLPSFDNLIDLSAVLVRFGRLSEAVQLLKFIERKYPGEYQTASNIGTAYELLGRNEDALKWIREGIKRNPNDHFGTEWLHVQILSAKLGRIPAAASGHSILNLDFGTEATPKRPKSLPLGTDGKPLTLSSLGYALRYQLLERIEFTPAPDPIVAGLLFDWANLELVAGTVETADVLYDAAIRYGFNGGGTIPIRKAQVAQILAKAKKDPSAKVGQCELCEMPSVTTETK